MARELKEVIGDLLMTATTAPEIVWRGVDVRALCAEAADLLEGRRRSTYIGTRYNQARQLIGNIRKVADEYEALLDRPATR